MKKIALKMEKGAGYLTSQGVRFTTEHPYQLVDESELDELMGLDKFRIATAEEVRSYYNFTSDTIGQEERPNV